MSNTAERFPAANSDTVRMRFPLLACSILAGIVGCMLFHLGGFMLFPLALDLWFQATEEPEPTALAPMNTKQVR